MEFIVLWLQYIMVSMLIQEQTQQTRPLCLFVILERCHVRLSGSGRAYGNRRQNGAEVSLVQRMLLSADLGVHTDPASGFQLRCATVTARDTAELDIVLTAGHHKPTGGKHAILFPAKHGYLCLKAYSLAVILLRLFRNVPIPQCVILILDLNNRRIDVEGQRILDIVKGSGAVSIIVKDIHSAICGPSDLMEGHGVSARLQAVEYHHLGAHQLVHHQIAHIGVISHESSGVREHDLLGHDPVLREAGIEVAHHLHTVQLRNDTLSLILFGKCL